MRVDVVADLVAYEIEDEALGKCLSGVVDGQLGVGSVVFEKNATVVFFRGIGCMEGVVEPEQKRVGRHVPLTDGGGVIAGLLEEFGQRRVE